jgi:predicted outer membrane repeat protein
MLMLIMRAPMATASDHLSLLAAAIDTIDTNANTNANATSNNTRIVSTDIASTIASWALLSESIAAAAGKTVTLMLSTPFDMTGFQSGSDIYIGTAQTAITIVGNAAVFDAGGKDRFFYVGQAVALVMSNVTLQNGNAGTVGGAIAVGGTITLSDCSFSGNTPGANLAGGAIYVGYGGTITLSNCSFSGNTADGYGGAIFVTGGTITLSDCSFSGNTADHAGGALFFNSGWNSNGLLKNCSLLGTISPKNNDIARANTSANVAFACADGEVGTPVQMSGTEIMKIPALTCH